MTSRTSHLVLETQSAAGLRGDLIEVGCFHGRSAVVLTRHLKAGERRLLVDALPTSPD